MLYVKESRLAATPEQVFAFHESPGALERLTPPWETVRVVRNDGSLRPGSRVVMKVALLGPIWTTWEAEHTEYDPPRGFADRQVRGPFSLWVHHHRFLDDGAGGTLLRDEVEFEPPLGALGRLLAGPALRAKIDRMFSHRHEITKRIVESGEFARQKP